MRTRIKFCGITRADDARDAMSLGVDALGFVFYAESPRFIEPAAARSIITMLPPFVTKVGLFVNAAAGDIARIVAETGIDVVQYHGDEDPPACAHAPCPWIKAVGISPALDIEREFARFAGSAGILLDAFDTSAYGGTGRTFDWDAVPAQRPVPLIIAGGLTPENVARAIRSTSPYAVDVSGGIEYSKGVKDVDRMRRFVAEVGRIERAG